MIGIGVFAAFAVVALRYLLKGRRGSGGDADHPD
jgi:hypothetical protein